MRASTSMFRAMICAGGPRAGPALALPWHSPTSKRTYTAHVRSKGLKASYCSKFTNKRTRNTHTQRAYKSSLCCGSTNKRTHKAHTHQGLVVLVLLQEHIREVFGRASLEHLLGLHQRRQLRVQARRQRGRDRVLDRERVRVIVQVGLQDKCRQVVRCGKRRRWCGVWLGLSVGCWSEKRTGRRERREGSKKRLGNGVGGCPLCISRHNGDCEKEGSNKKKRRENIQPRTVRAISMERRVKSTGSSSWHSTALRSRFE